MNHHDEYEEYATNYYNEIVNRLKKYCEIKECSQGMLSAKTGIAQSTISKMFSGEIKISINHIAKFCKALGIDPGEILTLNPKIPFTGSSDEKDNNSTLLFSPTHLAFNGYIGKFNTYFNSTISSENVILHGILEFVPSKDEKDCIANLELYTGKIKNGKEVKKNYSGKLIISLSMGSCYCILVAKDIGEMCFLVFDHMFLFNEDLSCRLACAITTSAGGNKRPTMHRLLLCKDELDVSDSNTRDYKFLQGHLNLNSSDIIISKTSLQKMKENEVLFKSDPEMIKLLNNFTTQCEDDTFYKIDEALIRGIPYSTKTKIEIITLLREYSIGKKYNKISSKADEYVYSYLSDRSS